MKASLVFYPNQAKAGRKNGRVPVYMRLSYKRSKSESRLNAELTTDDLCKWNEITMRLNERDSPVNFYLSSLEQKFQEFLLVHSTRLGQFRVVDIRNFILGIEQSSQKTGLQFAEEFFEKAIIHNSNRSGGTVKNYRRALNHLRSFLKSQRKYATPLEYLDYSFASDFKHYLLTNDPSKGRQGMTEISAAGVIKKFRTIFTHAVEEDLLRKNPFKQVKIKTYICWH